MKKINFLKNIYFNFFLLFFLTNVIINYSFSFFPIIESDSLSYINNENIRLAIYPFIIDLFKGNYDLIINFQISFLSLSIVMLIFSLRKIEVNLLFIAIFYILIISNIYYTSFSKTILTEAIYFSVINFSISILLIQNIFDKKIIFFIYGFLLGFVCSIRHEGIIISFFLILFLIISEKITAKKKIIFFLGFFILPVSENYLFYLNNETRNSVLDRSIFGKVFMLSAYSHHHNEYSEYLSIFSKESKQINKFLQNVNNPFLKFNLYSDYNVYAQYQIKNSLGENDKLIIERYEEEEIKILLNLIKHHPLIFFEHTLYNYVSLWMPGGKQIYLNNNFNFLPFLSNLKKTTGNINESNLFVLKIGLVFFMILFISFIVGSLLLILNFLKRIKISKNCSTAFLIIHFYLLSISILNVATPRYIMPVYPLILLFIFFQFQNFFKKNIA